MTSVRLVVYGAGMLLVREMTEADVDAVSAIRVHGWQTAYAGIIPQAYLDGMSAEADARERRARFGQARGGTLHLVAVDGRARTVGWACLGPYRGDAAPETGEVYALYVRPGLTGAGIGTALINTLHTRATDRRFDALMLWVLRDNLRARSFYASAGCTADGVTRGDAYGDVVLPALRYRRALP